MSNIPIYIGIDSGGTKTLALACTDNGERIASYKTVGANPYDIGWTRCYEIFSESIRALEADNYNIKRICISGAGIGKITAQEISNLSQALSVKPSQLKIIGDAYVAHLGAFAGKEGILVVAGTGTNLIARKQNSFIRVGGWGHILGDQCSGYGIALDAIRQAVLDKDLSIESGLHQSVKHYYSVNSNSELLLKLQNAPKSLVAGFVKEVLILAEAGDGTCIAIIDKHFEVLCQQLSYLSALLDSSAISCVGGLFESMYYRQMFDGLMELLGLDYQKAIYSPVEAAMQIAMGRLEPPELPND